MKWLLGAIVIFVCIAAYIRFSPSDPERWHVDPRAAEDPGQGGVQESFLLPYDPAMANGQLEALARAEPRHLQLHADGSGQTWIFRTRLMGYPDYLTWHVEAEGEGTRVTVLSRLRFGRSDLGVNGARLERWKDALGVAG